MTLVNNRALVDIRLTLAYLAEQPIIHTDETIGNISKLKKMRVMHNGQPISVPALSGNSFRGQLRDILADQLCSALSDQGTQRLLFTNNDAYGILYSGGALGEKSTSASLLKNFEMHIPSVRLMGAAFGNVMLPSKLAVTHIMPCAQETRQVVARMRESLNQEVLPSEDQWPKARDLLFNDGPLTRKDDRRDLSRQRFAEGGFDKTAKEAESEDEERQKVQQIYYVECIPPGTWLLQQLYTKFPLDQRELGCLFDGLTAFLEQPAIGGRSAAGYGQVNVTLQGIVDNKTVVWPAAWPKLIQDSITAYHDYLTNQQQTILDTLTAKLQQSGTTP